MIKENLKKVRQELGLSVAKFSEKIDIPAMTLTNYERGDRTPSANLFIQMNKKLNVNLNWFVSGEGEMFIKKEPAGLKEEIKQAFKEMIASGELSKNDFK